MRYQDVTPELISAVASPAEGHAVRETQALEPVMSNRLFLYSYCVYGGLDLGIQNGQRTSARRLHPNQGEPGKRDLFLCEQVPC